MPALDLRFFVFAILFGFLVGYILGRSAEDRTATLSACVACAAIGAVSWIAGASETMPEIAGASMTVGGISAFGLLLWTGRRPVS
ncbi:MAG: hypothetical protein WEA76_11615 [Acidimicrobiia bacterium]